MQTIKQILELHSTHVYERGDNLGCDYLIGDFGRYKCYVTLLYFNNTVSPFLHDTTTRWSLTFLDETIEFYEAKTLDDLNILLNKLSKRLQSIHTEMDIDLNIC